MQANYQPVVIRKLLQSGPSTREEIENELLKSNPETTSQSMTNTVLTVLQKERNKVIRKEGQNYRIDSPQFTPDQIDELIELCSEKIEEFNVEHSDSKFAVLWASDKDDGKIEDFAQTIREKGKVLWGVDWKSRALQTVEFPITGYISYKNKIIGIAKISNFTSHEETNEEDLSMRQEKWHQNIDNKNYLHFSEISRCEPFPPQSLQMLDASKQVPQYIQSRYYVKELKENSNFNVWIWSVDPNNWKILNEKNIWASKIPQKIREKVRPGDKVIFYVIGTNQFKGIFEFSGEWYDAIEPVWADETDSIIYLSQIKIKPLKLGAVKIYDFAHELEMFPTPDDIRSINLVLKGGSGYPSNNGKPISYDDYRKIFDLMEIKYFLFRYNPEEENPYGDILGERYHFSKTVQNWTKLSVGDKAIWFETDSGDYSFWGYGEISRLDIDSDDHKYAFHDNFTFFNPPSNENESPTLQKGTISIREKIRALPHFNNRFSILPITKDIYDEISGEIITKTMTEKTSSNSPLIFPRTNLDSIKEEIKKELLIDDHIIDQIISSLYSGKNVLLTGPVGTGKTHLAQLIPKLAWKEIGGYYPQTVTATSDWTTQDVIGGIFPKIKNNEITYLIQKGCVAETVSENWKNKQSSSNIREKKVIDGHEYAGVWLVIDEFNRANIDKAFGQLFTALEYKTLDIPTTDPNTSSEKLTIPEDYRIIGTLNTFDKHFLFRLSDALKRRFSFIEILPPPYSKKFEEIQFIAEKAIHGLREVKEELKINSFDDVKNNSSLMAVLENLYEIMAYIRLTKNLGTALLISMFRFILINYLITKDWDKSLDQALMTNLLPQLESLQYWQIDSVMNFVGGRIHELFRRFDIRNRPDVDRYEEELKTLTKYLKISNKSKNAPNWNAKFRTGELMRENNPISDLDPWNGISRPNLRNFRTALEGLKQEKGFFETEDMSDDSQ